MEAVFIALMALVVLGSGWVSLIVLYNLFKADNGTGGPGGAPRSSRTSGTTAR